MPGLFQKLTALAAVFASQLAPAQTDFHAEAMPMAEHSLLLDVTMAGDRAVAVGERGHILISGDYGLSWQQVPVPTRATLTAISFPDALNGWAVGHDNVILVSRDGGLSWKRQYPPGGIDERYMDVYFLDTSRGFALGAYGFARQTADGGETWEIYEPYDDAFHLNRMSRGPQGRLYLAIEAGDLMFSNDNGSQWDRLPSPYDGSLFGVLPLSHQTLLCYGLRGNVFRSLDGGSTWTPSETPATVLIMDAIRHSSGPVILAGQNGLFMLSRDAGRSFELWTVPVQGASALIECPDGSILAVGLNGVHRLNLPPTPQGERP